MANFHVTFEDANGDLHGVVVRDVADQAEAEVKARNTMNEICKVRLWDPAEFELVATEEYEARMLL